MIYSPKVGKSNILIFDKHQSQFRFKEYDKNPGTNQVKKRIRGKKFSFYQRIDDATQYL